MDGHLHHGSDLDRFGGSLAFELHVDNLDHMLTSTYHGLVTDDVIDIHSIVQETSVLSRFHQWLALSEEART